MEPWWQPIARAIVIGLALAMVSQAVRAGDRDHQDGFFLRLSAGAGGAATEADATGGKFKLSGTASDLNFAIGAIVTPNLALHGTLYGWTVNEPEADYGGLSAEVQGDLSLAAVGAGVTYYAMPLNLYFSGSLGFGSLQLEDTAVGEGETDNGLVIDATIGKEWWVGRKWGLGVAGGFGYHSIPGGDNDLDWKGTSLAIRFSATMN